MKERIEKVYAFLKKEKLQALVIDNPIDLLYLTEQELSLGRLLVEENASALFVDGRYIESCKKNCPLPVFLTQGYGKESSFVKRLKCKGKIGFDADSTAYASYVQLKKSLPPRASLMPLHSPIKHICAIKEDKEIECLKRAALLGSEGYDYLLTLFKEGITEEEVSAELEIYWKKKGGEKTAFTPIIAFGENASQPHYRSGGRKLRKGDLILMDIGVVLKGYHSDMTRVVSFGKSDPEFEDIYRIVKEAQAKALALCSPGKLIGDVSAAARDVIDSYGYGSYFTHGLGHGVGLEIHEYPVIKRESFFAKRPLQKGMVITIEPGIYLPGRGGIRLEDTVAITDDGYLNLTQRPLSENLSFLEER